MAAVPPEGEETSEPVKHQTWLLKVSIHCEGCKRKVKRILHSVDGVYSIDVDAKQHKVTVTGNVDSNTLIKRLEKSGKHAELWPDSQKTRGKSKKNKDSSSQNRQEQPQDQANQNNSTVESEKGTVIAEEQPQNNDKPENSNSGNGNTGNNSQERAKEVRFSGNIPTAANENGPPENNAGGNIGGGDGGKKKKKKGHKGNNTNAATTATSNNGNNNNDESAARPQQPNGAAQSSESPPPQPGEATGPYPNPSPSPDNMSPSRQPPNNRAYEYPPAYYTPPPPVYGVSYSTAYPSYTSSYYSAPPPYSYAYVHGTVVEPPPPSDWNSASTQPSDTFEMFSDENPNACSVM